MSEEAWQGVMQAHAKSFHLASLFFPRDVADKVKALYALCRWIDDAVDTAPDLASAEKRLGKIAADLVAEQPRMEVIQLYRAQGLEGAYLTDLAEGARIDLQGIQVQTREELLRYCYHVAGTVGLAMSDLMGVQQARARAFAVDLGIGMQLTNICRDVREDAELGRCYIPAELLKKHGLSTSDVLACPVAHPGIVAAVEELLQLADRYYTSARSAFPSIPFRARGAIIIASRLYQGIGLKLRRSGADPMRGRSYLRTHEKAGCVLMGLGQWLCSPWQRAELSHDEALHVGLERWKTARGFA